MKALNLLHYRDSSQPSATSGDHRLSGNWSQKPLFSVTWGLRSSRHRQIKKPRPVIRVPVSKEDEKIVAEALLMMAKQVPIKKETVQNQWPIKKVLTDTDVKENQSRLLIKKKDAVEHIVAHLDEKSVAELRSSDGLKVRVLDVDTRQMRVMTLVHIESGDCYRFRGGWCEHFVRRRGLKERDEIGMVWSQVDEMFLFTVLQKGKNLSSEKGESIRIDA